MLGMPWQHWAESALYALDNNVSRIEWVRILAAFYDASNGEGEPIAHQWSLQGYAGQLSENDWRTTWRSVQSMNISAGTLVYLAQQSGWRFPNQDALSHEQRKLLKLKIEQARQEAAERRQVQQHKMELARQQVTELAQAEWENIQFQCSSNNYLTKRKKFTVKQIMTLKAIGFQQNVVVIPAMDIEGRVHNLQKIYPKPIVGTQEHKFFHPTQEIANGRGGRIHGCMFMLGEIAKTGVILVTTGLADQLALHLSLGLPVVNGFNDHNLSPVIAALSRHYPEPNYTIINCADDDQWGEKNSGRTTAGKLPCPSVFPQFSAKHLNPERQPKDFWDMYDLEGQNAVRSLLERFISQMTRLPAPFFRKDKQLYKKVKFKDVETKSLEEKDLFIADFVKVVARATDDKGRNYACVVKFFDRQGDIQKLIFADEMLETPEKLRALLRGRGLRMSTNSTAKMAFLEYLNDSITNRWIEQSARTGWYRDLPVFVTPKEVIGHYSKEIMYDDSNLPVTPQFGGLYDQKGTLDNWRQYVAQPCVGNSRLVFALSCAFAPILLKWLPDAAGGFQLRGTSSEGKTTALAVAASVWGGVLTAQTWLSTASSLDKIGELYNHAFLGLDEIKQAPAKDIGNVMYMIAGGRGKNRSAQGGDKLQAIKIFTTIFLSTGEKTIQQLLEIIGESSDAGMEARMADLTANAGKGHGVFDTVHDFASGKDLSEHLNQFAKHRFYGVAAPAFIRGLLDQFASDTIETVIKDKVKGFRELFCPPDAEGQVHRVIERFALVAAAGELAIELDILPFPRGECVAQVGVCFQQWLADRGGSGQLEKHKIIEAVKLFIIEHMFSRFYDMDSYDKSTGLLPEKTINKLVGGRKTVNGQQQFLIFPSTFKNELCKQFPYKQVCEVLREAGILRTPSKGFTTPERMAFFKRSGKERVYKIILPDEEE